MAGRIKGKHKKSGQTRSQQLFERAQQVMVGGVNSPVRAFKSVGGDPVFAARGKGSRFSDVDGKIYVDYCLSWGPLILGHAHPKVVNAAITASREGSTFGMSTEREVVLAEKISEALPTMQLVRLTSSGTEAVMSALRVARAFTGRELVIKFEGCYHGHVDSLLVKAGSGALSLSEASSQGVPAAWAATTISAAYNDLQSVRQVFADHPGKIAAVIVEPIVGNMGVVLPKNGFLEGLRKITSENGALLIFDEVITGFRVAYGGAQVLYGIDPDLTTLGKILGGGYPIGAYGGRREIMEKVAPLGGVYQAGTLSGNPVAVAAGTETLALLHQAKPYERLAHLTQRLVKGLRSAAADAGVSIVIQHTASMFTLFFAEHDIYEMDAAMKADNAKYGRFFHAMLEQGVYFPPAQWEAAFLSTAHTMSDIEKTVVAARAAFQQLI